MFFVFVFLLLLLQIIDSFIQSETESYNYSPVGGEKKSDLIQCASSMFRVQSTVATVQARSGNVDFSLICYKFKYERRFADFLFLLACLFLSFLFLFVCILVVLCLLFVGGGFFNSFLGLNLFVIIIIRLAKSRISSKYGFRIP